VIIRDVEDQSISLDYSDLFINDGQLLKHEGKRLAKVEARRKRDDRYPEFIEERSIAVIRNEIVGYRQSGAGAMSAGNDRVLYFE